MSEENKLILKPPTVIYATNLSLGWAQVLLRILDGSGKELVPLVLSLDCYGESGEIVQERVVRDTLDGLLDDRDTFDIESLAFAIFPQRIWKMSSGKRERLFAFCKKSFARWKAMYPRANNLGLYFERLIQFGHEAPCDGNQLEWILSRHNGRKRVRRSMYQASIFDPKRDHTNRAQLGFPCLQQISFVPTKAGLITNAFYATQQVFDKAYGNYLGLAQLGAFMANEMGMAPARLNVMAGVAKLDTINKRDADLTPLVDLLRPLVAAT